VRKDKNTIEAYSERNMNTKVIDICSVLIPLTISDSASPKSKGARIVSHKINTIHNGKITNIGLKSLSIIKIPSLQTCKEIKERANLTS
jgi:hypothetical protein